MRVSETREVGTDKKRQLSLTHTHSLHFYSSSTHESKCVVITPTHSSIHSAHPPLTPASLLRKETFIRLTNVVLKVLVLVL